MKHLKIPIIISISLISFSSCKKFVLTDGPKDQVTSDLVFSDSTKANAAIAGIYYQMAGAGNFGLLSGGITLYTGLNADEISYSSTDATISAYFNNNILPNSDKNLALYSSGYKYIYSANACIDGISYSTQLSAGLKNQLIAEAKFLRAFTYFNLTNLYGGLPIITGTDYEQNRVIGRSETKMIYDLIISDLKFAQENFPQVIISKDRASYYAATALLAKAYLFTGQYAAAIAEADKVISSGKFSLESNLNNVFLAGSNETIWNTLIVLPLSPTYDGLNFIPTSSAAKPRYPLNANLYSAFETGDQRKISWVKVNTNAETKYPYPFKYKSRSTTTISTENYVMERLAELYLIRAEAKANLDDLNGGKADLNMIRQRAGLSNTMASDKTGLLQAIEKERRIELFCEWGNRWFDLKRTNRAVTVLAPLKPNLNENTLLYPIPTRELNTNPNLSQNTGY